MEMHSGGGFLSLIVPLAVSLFMVIAGWKIFTKAGKPGWAVLIPIYNAIVMLQIVGRPVWWFILFLVPVVNFVIGIIVMIDFAAAFGKRGGFVVGLLLLPIIFYPIVAFGDATYTPIER